MDFSRSGLKFQSLVVFVMVLFQFSCVEELESEVVIYSNDFSENDVANIENARLLEFNGQMVMGSYNNEEVVLSLPNLPPHNVVRVTVEILAHDSWDGNSYNVGGPDFWYMKLDGQEVIRTTFSNSACNSNLCLFQSFPENYLRQFEPKTGAMDISLPGLCQYRGVANYTTKYEISRLFTHKENRIEIICGDELKQENTANPKCDESWSVSRIVVTALSVK